VKPAICEICGAREWELQPEACGEWVHFSDYSQSDLYEPLMLGHTSGEEYFCAHHLAAAKVLSWRTSVEAIRELRAAAGAASPTPIQERPLPSFLRQFVSKIFK
jgi:hypothetical protein